MKGSPLKMMKNYFYLKALCFLRYLHFCPDFFLMLKKGLIRKLRLISKFRASQTGKKIVTIHILPNISRGKGNQTMIFGHLIEYNMRISFLEKPHTKCVVEASSRTFCKNSKLILTLDQQSEML